MKIYNKVVIDLRTGETIEEDSYEYNGSIMKCGPAIVPVVQAVAVAAFSAAATAVVEKNMGPDAPEMPQLPGQELLAAEEQPVEPKDTLKEQEMLAAETKRKKQGYLQSFGGMPEETQSFGLI